MARNLFVNDPSYKKFGQGIPQCCFWLRHCRCFWEQALLQNKQFNKLTGGRMCSFLRFKFTQFTVYTTQLKHLRWNLWHEATTHAWRMAKKNRLKILICMQVLFFSQCRWRKTSLKIIGWTIHSKNCPTQKGSQKIDRSWKVSQTNDQPWKVSQKIDPPQKVDPPQKNWPTLKDRDQPQT